MLTIGQAETAAEIAAVRAVFREYLDWWAGEQPEDFFKAPAFKGLDEELASLPGTYAPPDGRLLLATADGQAAGAVGLKRYDDVSAEVKRLYVRPGFRGQNVGWQLINRLIAEARLAGYARLVLDTHITMHKALAVYQAAGFRPMATPPDDLPEALRAVVVYLEYDLAGARGPDGAAG